MIKLPFLFLFSAITLFAKDSPLEDNHLSSTHASYDGNALILEGRVQLDHGLGKMNADQAFLQKQEAGKDFPFSLIHLKKEVLLSLKNKAELKCDTAELDFQTLTGKLSAPENSYVSYTETSPTEIRMISQFIDLGFIKNETNSEQTQYKVDSLKASTHVQIDYAKEFSLKADEATYQSETPQGSSFQGIIKAYPTTDTTPYCSLSYQGEEVKADSIELNLTNHQIFLQAPQGNLPSRLISQGQTGSLFFRSKELTWDQLKETLLLKGQVEIQEDNIGSLYSENEMFIEQGTANDKKFVKSLHTSGLTRLKRENSLSGWNHSLTCLGTLHIDGVKGQISLISPQEKGRTPEDKQLLYTDEQMVLHADKAFIEYSEQTYQPISLTLKGQVKIQSSNPSEPLRCGLADRLTYSPDTETVILSALPKNRVIFTDKEQGLSMSAQEVHLTKDPVSGKTQIKGVGNVKFSLSKEENDLLQIGIPSYKPLPE